MPQKSYYQRLRMLAYQTVDIDADGGDFILVNGVTVREVAEYQNLSISGARKFLERARGDGFANSVLEDHGRFGLRVYYTDVSVMESCGVI